MISMLTERDDFFLKRYPLLLLIFCLVFLRLSTRQFSLLFIETSNWLSVFKACSAVEKELQSVLCHATRDLTCFLTMAALFLLI